MNAHNAIAEAALPLTPKGNLTPDQQTILYAYYQALAGKISWEDAHDALRDLRIL